MTKMIEEEWLLDVPCNPVKRLQTFKSLEHPIWTENKAKLIEKYLWYFVWVTRHGTYIDAFAGPQRRDQPEMWAARLVLKNRPAWIKHFHWFELDSHSIPMLESLRNEELVGNSKTKRNINIYAGDCNINIPTMLEANPIKASEATFCLLDQRTFECDWATVVTLAKHKKEGHKIELFYFLANGWIHRAASRKTNKNEEMERWYGSDGWETFMQMDSFARAQLFSDRFKQELGYKFVYQFPIYKKGDGGKTMYWMIHATDHPLAPKLMYQAYRRALSTQETEQQMQLLIDRASESI